MAELPNPFFHFTFLRHGESVGNLEKRHQGHADFALTEKGRLQATALAGRWKAEGRLFDRALSSPLLRARETAEIICTALGVPLAFDPDLKEIDNGLMAGRTTEEAAGLMIPAETMTSYTHFGRTGESRWQVYLRAGRVVQKLVDASPGRTLVVAHGGILNMTLYAILGIPLQNNFAGARFLFKNTTFTTFTYEPQRHIWRMHSFDDRSHLDDREDEE